MVKDPLIDFEEVVVGIRSLGLIPRPEGALETVLPVYGPLSVQVATKQGNPGRRGDQRSLHPHGEGNMRR